MPEYHRSDSFKEDYKELVKNDEAMERAIKKAFALFKENPNHPSLRVHPMQGYDNVWEGHISQKHVFTFSKERNASGDLIYRFRRVGDHTIYKNP